MKKRFVSAMIVFMVALLLLLLPFHAKASKHVNSADYIGKNCTSANDCSDVFVCRNGVCGECQVDTDCFYSPAYVCTNMTEYMGCHFKALWPPSPWEIGASIVRTNNVLITCFFFFTIILILILNFYCNVFAFCLNFAFAVLTIDYFFH